MTLEDDAALAQVLCSLNHLSLQCSWWWHLDSAWLQSFASNKKQKYAKEVADFEWNHQITKIWLNVWCTLLLNSMLHSFSVTLVDIDYQYSLTAPLLSCTGCLVSGSILLHVLPIFPTQKLLCFSIFFVMGFQSIQIQEKQPQCEQDEQPRASYR